MSNFERTTSWQQIQQGVKEAERLIVSRDYNLVMVKARQTLECMVRCLAEKACLVDGDLADTIDQLYEGHWIDKATKDDYHTIRILGNKAVHENDNTAYNANQAYQLLTKQVSAFSHDFQVAKTFTVPVTDTRPVRNARTGATTGSSGAGSASYGQTGGARPRTGTGAGQTAASRAQSSVRSQTSPRSQTSARTSNGTAKGPRSGAELQGLSSRSGANGSRRTAGSNSSTGSRNRNSKSTNRSYSGSSRSGRTRRRKHRPSPVAMVLKFLIPILVIVVLVVAIRTLVPGKKKADLPQPETMSTEMTSAETEAPTPEETQPPADVYVVTGNKVNVRTEPSTNGRILVQLEGGTEVAYVKRYNNDWTVINYDGQEAYVSSQYIAKQEAETTAETQAEAETAAEGETAANQ